MQNKMEQYLRHKKQIKEHYQRKMDALREIFRHEWDIDHRKIVSTKPRNSHG